MKSTQKTLLAWFALVIATLLLFQTARVNRTEKRLAFNKFIEHVKTNHIESVTFKAHGRIEGKFLPGFENGQPFETVGDTNSEFYVKLLADHNLTPNYEVDEGNSLWVQFLIGWGPMLIFLVLLLVFLRQIQVSGGKAMQFG